MPTETIKQRVGNDKKTLTETTQKRAAALQAGKDLQNLCSFPRRTKVTAIGSYVYKTMAAKIAKTCCLFLLAVIRGYAFVLILTGNVSCCWLLVVV